MVTALLRERREFKQRFALSSAYGLYVQTVGDLLPAAFEAEKRGRLGSIFVTGNAALWRGLGTFPGPRIGLAGGRGHRCSVVVIKNDGKQRTVDVQGISDIVIDKT